MFRVTPFSISDSAAYYHRSHLAELARLQRQISSGLKYERPSDDPRATAQIRAHRSVESGLTLQQGQIEHAQFQLNQSVSQLLTGQQVLTRGKQIALEAPQTTDPAARAALVAEVDALIQQLFSIANSQIGTQYLYAGTSTTTLPVTQDESPDLAIPWIQYQASRARKSLDLSESMTVDVRYTAEEIFLSRDRGPTLYFGESGAASGTGTDSGVGRAVLAVAHTATTYVGATGLAPGASSASGDTVIGPLGRHYVTLTDTSGTGAAGIVSLNGGTPVNFTNADTDLRVTGPRGEVVYLDLSAITPGVSVKVDLVADGTLSVDGGTTTLPIDFSANQIVGHSVTGAVTHVDSSGVWQAGETHLEYTDSADALTALYELRADLLNARGLDEQTLATAFQRRAADLQRASDQLLQAVGQQSSALQNLTLLSNRNAELKLDIQQALVESESINVADVVTDLQNRQTLLQFSFSTFAVLQNTNILDFLK